MSGTADLIAEGITYRKIDYWCRQGYLKVDHTGSGVARDWPARELRVARLMHHLISGGMTTSVAADLARRATEHREGTACRYEVQPGMWVEVTS